MTKPKLYPLTDEQVETLKSLLATTVEECKEDVEPCADYIGQLTDIYDILMIDAPNIEGMAREIHQLKNQVQGLKMELHLKGDS